MVSGLIDGVALENVRVELDKWSNGPTDATTSALS